MGLDWVKQNLDDPIKLKVQKADVVGDRIFIDGNSAAALGAVPGLEKGPGRETGPPYFQAFPPVIEIRS